jgi:ketosteroid isomerase-like protein
MAGAGSDRPASPPDVAVVRRWFDAFNRRDLAQTLALAHPEIAFHPLQVHGGGTWHGRDGVEALWARMAGLGLTHRVEIARVETLEDGDVAALGVVQPGDAGFVGIYRVDGGLVRDARHRFSDEDTLRALGLLEPGG